MQTIDTRRSDASPTTRKFTVLHTEWSDGWGGQERRVLSEMVGMCARGYQQILACRSSSVIGREAKARGIRVVHLPFAGKFDLASIVGLKRLIDQEGVNLVSTHSGIDSWVGSIAARWSGALIVRTRHLNLPLKRNIFNFVHYLPHAVVTCGEVMRQNLVDRGFPPSDVLSIPTGIDFDSFRSHLSRADARNKLQLPESCFAIAMVGIIRGVKRHEVALRAFALFRDAHPQARLLLVGDGPMSKDMRQLAEELGLGQSVSFLGHRDDVADLLAAADCFLLSSRSEGVPQAITQALGCGLPVVATAVGGVPELIIDGRTGLLVEPESPQLMAEALARVADDAALASRLGQAGKAHVEEHYSLQAMLNKTEALYARLQGSAA